ncbi:Undecaprenol kinase [Caulifigura coniformis]|uniref:Undecaprenol kinase n=1 Tax=Caulifigura coniformis TaxID=2527983 RepID=A0A517S821_9PLAN|nr:diacylglycerol kinase family protein [Caulifigura coniformis]QDT52267.1 Undecaprenol kinase [Caulifigura coniformis]
MTEVRPIPDESRPLGRTTLLNAFRVAFSGFAYALRTQRNLQIHVAIAGIVVTAGLFFGLNRLEWCLIIVCIGLTGTAELLNTSVEVLVDLLSPEYHERARVAKDVAAAAVLCSALASAVVGVLVFGPRLAG